jgi:transcriptional regulator of acetoin/glycerol metabolism
VSAKKARISSLSATSIAAGICEARQRRAKAQADENVYFMDETGWQKTQAAALLGITRATLYAKVKQYDIRKEGPSVEKVRLAAPQPSEAVGAAC